MRRLEPADAAQRLARRARARGVDHDDVRRAGAVAQLLEAAADVAGEEGGVREPVQLGVLDRARDRLLRGLDPQTVSASRARVSPIVPIPQ